MEQLDICEKEDVKLICETKLDIQNTNEEVES